MVPPPGLQINVWPHVTLTFDPVIPKVDYVLPLVCEPLVPIDVKISSFVLRRLGTDEQTSRWTG